jgi:hypothetical protein
MAKPPRKKIKRRAERVLLSMTGRGMRDGWVTFKLPAWLVVLIVVGACLIAIAVIASPELAAKVAALLMQLAQLSTSQKQ